MQTLKQIENELERGFTKSELERILDLPKNSLSSILAGRSKLSKKALIRVIVYFEKPLRERPEPSPKIARGRKPGTANKPKDKKGGNDTPPKSETKIPPPPPPIKSDKYDFLNS